jgi:hypothetical protein
MKADFISTVWIKTKNMYIKFDFFIKNIGDYFIKFWLSGANFF